MRSAPPSRALDRDFSLKYALRQEEVDVTDFSAYLVREEPREGGSYSAGAGVLLLPDAAGWKHARTRRLADRLAVFCSCLVLVPDLHRGAAGWEGPAAGTAFDAWQSGLPPARLASDARECAVHMRADLRVERMGLVGLGLGGRYALAEISRDAALLASAAVAICPPAVGMDGPLAPKVPLLCVFGGGGTAAARAAREQLEAAGGAAARTGAVTVSALQPPPPPPPSAAPQTPRRPSEASLGRRRVAELRESLEKRSLPTEGRKAERVARAAARANSLGAVVGTLVGGAGREAARGPPH